MMTWVLILTLVAPASTAGSSIHSVPGFLSVEECKAAGNAWLETRPPAWSQASALCVHQTQPQQQQRPVVKMTGARL